MNKNILILSVLLVLNSTAFADAGDQAVTAEKPVEKLLDKPATKPTAEPPAPTATEKEKINAVKVDGRDVVKDSDGKLVAYFCETGMDCRKQVLATEKISDLAAISAELKKITEETKKAEESKKTEVAKKEKEEDKFDKKEFTKDLLADLEDSILDSCDIETKSNRKRDRDDDLDDDDFDTDRPSWARVRSRVRGESSRSSIASSRRFTRAQSEESDLLTDQSSECSAEALQEKLEELTQSFDEDLKELGLKKSDLSKLDEITENLELEIRKEKDPKKKEVLELALSKVENLSEKVKITQNITQKFVKNQVLPTLENDLVRYAGYNETSLHEIAAGTPDLFKGVRKDASVSILEVYKKQIRTQIALRDAGNLEQSNQIGNLAIWNRLYMTRPQQNNKSAGQNFMEKFALNSNLESRSHVQELFNQNELLNFYNASTSSLLGGTQNKALPLPGVFSNTEAGVQNPTGRLSPSNHTVGRAQRSGQVVSPQQGRASVPAPNGPPNNGGVRRGF